MICTRPDIAYAVSFLARFSEARKNIHWNAVKCVFRYLRETTNLGLVFSKHNDNASITCYVDADYAGDYDTRKSTSGYVGMFNNTPIIWESSKQSIVAMSTTEAEFVAASLGCREVLWTRQLLEDIGREQLDPTPILIDNQGAKKIITNMQLHSKVKHIDIKYMIIRHEYASGKINVQYIQSKEQIADILTKALERDSFCYLRAQMA